MALIEFLLGTIERYVQELQRPGTFLKLFDQLVARRGDNYFEWYRNSVADFAERFRVELDLVGLRLWPLDEMSWEVFAAMRQGRSSQNVLASIVVDDERKPEVALFFRSPNELARAHTSRDQVVPTMALALPNHRYSLRSYRSITRAELQGLVRILATNRTVPRRFVLATRPECER